VLDRPIALRLRGALCVALSLQGATLNNEEFNKKVVLLKRLGLAAAVGFALILAWVAMNPEATEPPAYIFLAFPLVMPVVVYLVLLTIWHWKSRYRGGHSNLWGGLLVIEASGWFKLIYLFRHIIPDYRGTGRYARESKS